MAHIHCSTEKNNKKIHCRFFFTVNFYLYCYFLPTWLSCWGCSSGITSSVIRCFPQVFSCSCQVENNILHARDLSSSGCCGQDVQDVFFDILTLEDTDRYAIPKCGKLSYAVRQPKGVKISTILWQKPEIRILHWFMFLLPFLLMYRAIILNAHNHLSFLIRYVIRYTMPSHWLIPVLLVGHIVRFVFPRSFHLHNCHKVFSNRFCFRQ